jgi:hypothetical protein
LILWRRALPAAASAVALVAGASCGGDGGSTAQPAVSTTTGASSTSTAGSLVAPFTERYGPALRAMGLRITRAGRTAEYGADAYTADGPNIALYLAPTNKVATDDPSYLDRLPELVSLLLPSVFSAVDGAVSIDVCQEPYEDSSEGEPTPVTTFVAARSKAEEASWEGIDLQELITRSKRPDKVIAVVVGPAMARSRSWVRVRDEALRQNGLPVG